MNNVIKLTTGGTLTTTPQVLFPSSNISGTISWTTIPQTAELKPTKIIYNEDKTIVYWNDGTKTVSKASENEVVDPEIGFAICLMKKMYGKKINKKKLYRKMIAKAEVHGEMARDVFNEWKEERFSKDNR